MDRLASLGYVERVDDAADARRKLIRLTDRGVDVLARSAAIFEKLRSQWAKVLGAKRLRELEANLRTMASAETFRPTYRGGSARRRECSFRQIGRAHV